MRGRAVIALVFFAVIGIIVGGVVGATMQTRKSPSESVSPTDGPSVISDQAQAGTVPVTSDAEPSSSTLTSLPSLITG